MQSKAQKIIDTLGLIPHPAEGGWFIETYRSTENISLKVLPARYGGERPFGTCIYYMLTPDTFSAMHRLQSDEIFHFYLGDPVEMLLLYPDGTTNIITIGSDLFAGMQLQVIVPAGIWQASRLIKGGSFALLGTTVAPGFDFADYEDGDRDTLVIEYPAVKDEIKALTRNYK